jgi:hypothetical protein
MPRPDILLHNPCDFLEGLLQYGLAVVAIWPESRNPP